MAETIQTYCPCCGGELQGEPEWVGGKALCPYCQKAFIISSAQESTSVDEGVSTSREELSLESDNCDFGGDPNTDDTGSSGNMSTGDAWRKRRFPLWQIDAARFVALIFLVALIVCNASHKTRQKPSNGIARRPNKAMPGHNAIWAFATTTAKASHKTRQKPSNGYNALQSRV